MNNMNECNFGLVSFSRVGIHDDKKGFIRHFE